VWTTLGRGVGFLVPFFIAAWFGVNEETDAFFYTYGLILFLSGILSPVIETIIVPYIAEARSRGWDIGGFLGKIVVFGGGALALIVLVVLVAAKPVLALITRFDASTNDLIFVLFLEGAPLVFFMAGSSLIIGALNAYQKFTFPALSPAMRAAITLAFILLYKDSLGIHSVTFGYLIGEVVRLIILMVVVRLKGLFKIRLGFRPEAREKEFFANATIQTVSMIVVSLTPLVDKTMASWLGRGSITILHYADRLYIVPYTLLSAGLLIAMLSHLSQRFYEDGPQRLQGDLMRMIKVTAFSSLVLLTAIMISGGSIVNLALGHGKLAPHQLLEVKQLWFCYLIGFVPHMVNLLVVQVHLVMKNIVFLMKLSMASAVLNIVFNLIFMRWFGLFGIVLSSSVIRYLMGVYAWRSYRKKMASIEALGGAGRRNR
jgi:putative peptidoglycan lipid II flippase